MHEGAAELALKGFPSTEADGENRCLMGSTNSRVDAGLILVSAYTSAMNPHEYINLARVEKDHWYYSGKRELVRRLIGRSAGFGQNVRLLDCGAGTGIFAEEMSGLCEVSVLDDHDESIRLLKQKFPEERVLRVSGTQIPVGPGGLDVVTAMDVLEHIEADQMAVGEFARILRSGGFAVVTVPASKALWSDWDEGLHHFRRYDKAGLRKLFEGPEWAIVTCRYTNSLAFPVVWILRKLRRFSKDVKEGGRSEDRVPFRPINGFLKRLFVAQALCPVPMPFGVSLVLMARRR